MKNGKSASGRMIFALSVIVLMSVTISASAQTCPTVIENGKAYEKMSADWWKWAYSFPVSINPLFDETGDFAYLGDRGNVFYLAGVFNVSGMATRTISVPAGKPIFFPVLNILWDNVGVRPPYLNGKHDTPATFEPMSVPELRAMAGAAVDEVSELHVTVDGCPIPDLFSYRAKSSPFSFTFPRTDNIYQLFGYDVSGTIAPAVSDGYWILLAPLPPGQHTINFGGSVGNPTFFSLDITYHITVTP